MSLQMPTVKGEIMAFFPQLSVVARRGGESEWSAAPAALAEHCIAAAPTRHTCTCASPWEVFGHSAGRPPAHVYILCALTHMYIICVYMYISVCVCVYI